MSKTTSSRQERGRCDDVMQRVTLRVDQETLQELDYLVEETDEFGNRSAAIREAIDELLDGGCLK